MDGVVVLLKPPGMTSFDAVYDVRRLFYEKRAGHLGTLDPGAAGVLPICLGRATRLFDLLVNKEKEYVFELAFGAKTDTQDCFGRVTAFGGAIPSMAQVTAVLPRFCGAQMQKASVFSALRVNGKKMYELARAGEDVTPREREIVVSRLTYLTQTAENKHLLSVCCSRGTYIRALAESIGDALTANAHMSFLLRARSGPFDGKQAFTLEELRSLSENGALASAVIPCEEALSFLPALTLEGERKTPTQNGLDTFLPDAEDGNYRLYCDGFLGVGRVKNQSARLAIHLYERTSA